MGSDIRISAADDIQMRYIEHRIGGETNSGNGITILLTGFGPFREHRVNASWQSVRLIPEKGITLPSNISQDTAINLIIYEIPVIYQSVARLVPELWEKHQPDLTIHVGVSGIAKATITLEKTAHNCGYSSTDVRDEIPAGNVCIADACDSIESTFNMEEVVQRLNSSCFGVTADLSYDPGRYLCDFIYYQSLNINKDRTAFIHVPPLGKPYTAEQISDGICTCITELLSQLQDRKALSLSTTSSGSSNDSFNLEQNRL